MELPKAVPVGEERKGLLYSAYPVGEEEAQSYATGGHAGKGHPAFGIQHSGAAG